MSQSFSTNDASADATFSYVLEATSAGAPMPTGAQGDTWGFTLVGSQSTEVRIPCAVAGIYTYRVYQDTSAGLAGYTYDGTVYSVTVYVRTLSDGSLAAEVVARAPSGKKPDVLSFASSYKGQTAGGDTETGATVVPVSNGGSLAQTGDEAGRAIGVALVGASLGLMLLAILVRRREGRDG